MLSSKVASAASAKISDENDLKLANSAAKKASPSPSSSSNSTCSSCCCDPSPTSKLDMAAKPPHQKQFNPSKLGHVHFCEDELDSANSGPLPSAKWRSSPSPARSFENPNLTLHRALLALRKQQKPVPTSYGGSSDQAASCIVHNSHGGACFPHQCGTELGNCNVQSNIKSNSAQILHNHHHCAEADSGRSITNSDARTLSMRERGRWGNTKMSQQQRHSGGGGSAAAADLQFDEAAPGSFHRQPLNHFQCLHCGSFSTTPIPTKGGGSSGVGSGPRVRRLRDYSWQQEMLHKKEFGGLGGVAGGGGGASIPSAVASAAARAAACEDRSDSCECRRCSHSHLHGAMTWQEKYMMLCEAIAAGAAFGEDACCAEDCGGVSGPAAILARQRRRYMCDVGNRSFGSGRGGAGVGGGYCSSANSERMMELEAFSGPLGYVSESKGEGLMEESAAVKSGSKSKWWARLPSFAKSKSERTVVAKAAQQAATPQATANCDLCGQRTWVQQGEVGGSGVLLCPECHSRGLGGSPEHGLFGQALGGGCRPPCFTPSAAHRPPGLHFPYKAHKHCPRRWRLVKLCRYLLGFPMQR